MAISDLTNVQGLAYDDTNDVLSMVADDNVYTVDKSTGEETLVGAINRSDITDIVYFSGTLYAARGSVPAQDAFGTLDPAWNSLTVVNPGDFTGNDFEVGLAPFSSSGIFAYWQSGSTNRILATITISNFSISQLYDIPNTVEQYRLTDDGTIIFTYQDAFLESVSVDDDTLTHTRVGTATGWGASITSVHAIVYDPDDDALLIVAEIADGTKSLYRVDKVTGTATLITLIPAPPTFPETPTVALLQLTNDEIADVRLQLGSKLTPDNLSDAQITSGSMLGSATDYVFERVREDLDLEALDTTERGIAERFRDESAEDVAAFINIVLKPPQRSQMRRAVVFRTAGLCAPVISRTLGESYAGINQRQLALPASVLQDSLFQRCEEEIDRLRNAFPDDAFLSNKQRVASGFAKVTLMTTTRSY